MSSSLVVLDVGHGNCSILTDEGVICVVDAGRGPYASVYLERAGIRSIDLIVISHTDDDHLGGIVGLLSSEKFTIKEIAINADCVKDTKIWRDVRALLQSKFNQGEINLRVGVFQGQLKWSGPKLTFEVLAPNVYSVLGGVGSKDSNGEKITANSGSVVLRVVHPHGVRALLAADMEESTLDQIVNGGLDVTAPILVYPHHGGRPGPGSPEAFSARIVAAVKPTFVVFSNGRERHNNPRPEVVGHVCASGNIEIACTQISKSCHPTTKKQLSVPWGYASGADEGRSCAGTLEFDLESGMQNPERMRLHHEFVSQLDAPMCKGGKRSGSAIKIAVH